MASSGAMTRTTGSCDVGATLGAANRVIHVGGPKSVKDDLAKWGGSTAHKTSGGRKELLYCPKLVGVPQRAFAPAPRYARASTHKLTRDWHVYLKRFGSMRLFQEGYALPNVGKNSGYIDVAVWFTSAEISMLEGSHVRSGCFQCYANWFQVSSWSYWYYGTERYIVTFRLDAQTYKCICDNVAAAEQEKTAHDAVAALPTLSRTRNAVNDSMGQASEFAIQAYKLVATIVAVAYANMSIVAQRPNLDDWTPDDFTNTPDDPSASGRSPIATNPGSNTGSAVAHFAPRSVQGDSGGKVPEEDEYVALRRRVAQAKPNELRESVTIKVRTQGELQEAVERGHMNPGILPDADDEHEMISAVIVAPKIIDIIPCAKPCLENEVSGVNRHLRVLKSAVTGKTLKAPDTTTEARLDMAAGILGEHLYSMLARDPAVMDEVLDYSYPQAWTQDLKDIIGEQVAELEGEGNPVQPFYVGFNKFKELMLPLTKHMRLIGHQKPLGAGVQLPVVGPIERLFKLFLKHLGVKGMTPEEIDERMERFCRSAKKTKWWIVSLDYSAMDSSWTLKDRGRVRKVMSKAMGALQKHIRQKISVVDNVLSAHAEKRKLKWVLTYLTVAMDAIEALLFSGERFTSIGNRIVVLVCRGAELIRIHGEEKGREMFLQLLEGELDIDAGDGDDEAALVGVDDYESFEHMKLCYEAMHKLIEPSSSFKEPNCLEVLSRYHIKCGQTYYHVAKPNRNLGRMIAFKIDRLSSEGDVRLRDDELRQIATDLWQRSFSLRHTLVVRQFCRACFDYVCSKMSHRAFRKGSKYSADDKRLQNTERKAGALGTVTDGDVSFDQMRLDVYANVSEDVPGSVMVKIAHFGKGAYVDGHWQDYPHMTAKQVREEIAAWKRADEEWYEMQFSETHRAYPATLIEDYPVHQCVAKELGIDVGTPCISTGELAEVIHPPAPDRSGRGTISFSSETNNGGSGSDAVGGSKSNGANVQSAGELPVTMTGAHEQGTGGLGNPRGLGHPMATGPAAASGSVVLDGTMGNSPFAADVGSIRLSHCLCPEVPLPSSVFVAATPEPFGPHAIGLVNLAGMGSQPETASSSSGVGGSESRGGDAGVKPHPLTPAQADTHSSADTGNRRPKKPEVKPKAVPEVDSKDPGASTDKRYVCDCGKLYDNLRSFNRHKRFADCPARKAAVPDPPFTFGPDYVGKPFVQNPDNLRQHCQTDRKRYAELTATDGDFGTTNELDTRMPSEGVNTRPYIQNRQNGKWHTHSCVACGTRYAHVHAVRGKHGQFNRQCPNASCERYHRHFNFTGAHVVG